MISEWRDSENEIEKRCDRAAIICAALIIAGGDRFKAAEMTAIIERSVTLAVKNYAFENIYKQPQEPKHESESETTEQNSDKSGE
jgi:hypothetical protein